MRNADLTDSTRRAGLQDAASKRPELTGAAIELRRLREERGVARQAVRESCGVSEAHLFKIETGAVARPARETLERILGALDEREQIAAPRRKALYELFGYGPTSQPPNHADIDAIRATWKQGLEDIPEPAYLVDISQRIHDWNDVALLMLAGDAHAASLRGLRGTTVFDLAFRSALHSPFTMLDRERLLANMVFVMKCEFAQFRDEPWCKECVGAAMRKYPEFRALWDQIPQSKLVPVINRIIGPVEFETQGMTLRFQIRGIDVPADPRFRVVSYRPLDELTSIVCMAVRDQSRQLQDAPE